MQKDIIFIHGNSGSPKDWRFLCDALDLSIGTHFINLKGNPGNLGQDYSLQALCEDSINQIKSLNLKEYYIVAHSLGAHVAFQISNQLKNSCRAIFSFGAPPLSFKPVGNNLAPFLENESTAIFSSEGVDIKLLQKTYLQNFSGQNLSFESFSQNFSQTDGRFRKQVFASVMAGEFNDEINTLNEFSGTVFFCLCPKDPIIDQNYVEEAARMITKATVLKPKNMENQKHYPHIEAPGLMAELIQGALFDTMAIVDKLKASNELPSHA
jgi:pimeloyl-ACP methyl ester carboxylesterase